MGEQQTASYFKRFAVETFKKKIFNAFLLPIKLRLGHQQTEGGEEIVEACGEEARNEMLSSESGGRLSGGTRRLSCGFLEQWFR